MYFPIVIDETVYGLTRDELFEKLEKVGIHARKYFYPLCSDFDCYKNKYDSLGTPIAKEIANRVLTLPMYSDLANIDIKNICFKIMEA